MSDTNLCPCCGQLNQCAQAQTRSPVSACWCFNHVIDAERLASLPPEQRNRSCLCPSCAQGLPEATTESPCASTAS